MNLIVFDIDGTVTDTVEAHHEAFREGLYSAGLKEITKEFKTFKHYTDSYIAKEIFESESGLEFTAEKFIEFEKELTNKICNATHQEIKGATALIEKLESTQGFGHCFATGSLRRAAEHKLKSVGIEFEEWQLVGADQFIERESIVTQAIENAKRHYGVNNFERITALGDGLWDLKTAQNLELEFIGVGQKNREILLENGAEIVVDDLLSSEEELFSKLGFQ